jgi:hypothetical protein
MILILKLFDYKVDRVADYNFDIKFIFIWVRMKKLWVIFCYRDFRFACFDSDETY